MKKLQKIDAAADEVVEEKWRCVSAYLFNVKSATKSVYGTYLVALFPIVRKRFGCLWEDSGWMASDGSLGNK